MRVRHFSTFLILTCEHVTEFWLVGQSSYMATTKAGLWQHLPGIVHALPHLSGHWDTESLGSLSDFCGIENPFRQAASCFLHQRHLLGIFNWMRNKLLFTLVAERLRFVIAASYSTWPNIFDCFHLRISLIHLRKQPCHFQVGLSADSYCDRLTDLIRAFRELGVQYYPPRLYPSPGLPPYSVHSLNSLSSK